MQDFFQQYFMEPIITQGIAGYNIFNTPVYALGFALAVFGAYKLLKRLEIKIDRRFLIGILPFILSGGVWRVVRDAQILTSPLLVTPLIYFVLFAVTITALLLSVGVERFLIKAKERRGELREYHKIWFVLGMVVLLCGFALLAQLPIRNWDALGIITALSAGWGVAIFVCHRLSHKLKAFGVFTRENACLLWAHMFDASTTFTALQFFAGAGYYEQHVVSAAVIGALGPAGQFLLKLVVLIPVLWLLDKELHRKEDSQLRGFIKIAILILGLALGTRNMLRLCLGV